MIRPFEATDILHFNSVNADAWTATVSLTAPGRGPDNSLKEQYGCHYYSNYVATWPEMCMVAESAFEAGPSVKAYSASAFVFGSNPAECWKLTDSTVIGKDEPPPPNPQHHAHLTAMSITPSFRGLGLARLFMDHLELLASDGQVSSDPQESEGEVGEGEDEKAKRKDCVDAWFVDLFVRCNNHRAVEMYERLGYSVYRRVVE